MNYNHAIITVPAVFKLNGVDGHIDGPTARLRAGWKREHRDGM
jgi:hypothetical protein